jgi:hypothetical protein
LPSGFAIARAMKGFNLPRVAGNSYATHARPSSNKLESVIAIQQSSIESG